MSIAPIGLDICMLSPQLMNCLEGLGGVPMLEDICSWGWTLRFQKSTPGPVSLHVPVD